MSDDEFPGQRDEGEVEVTPLRLRPASMHEYDADGRRPRTRTLRWRRLAFGVSLLLLLAALPGAVTVGRRAGMPFLSGSTGRPAVQRSASATPTSAVVLPLVPTPTNEVATPTAPPGGAAPPPLGAAPPSCDAEPPGLTPAGPPAEGEAISFPPVRLGGFTGTYATLRLGPSALSYGWKAPYTRYGWAAGILLLVRSDFTRSVTLTGWSPLDGRPLWFGFIEAGVWGAPTLILPSYTLDPTHPSIPAGGADSANAFWYGYVFLPRAGCYTLVATWPGGDWAFLVSAGR